LPWYLLWQVIYILYPGMGLTQPPLLAVSDILLITFMCSVLLLMNMAAPQQAFLSLGFQIFKELKPHFY